MGKKIDEGDSVRLKRNMEFGNVQLPKNTKGRVEKKKKKAFGSNEYVIRWDRLNFDVTMIGEKNIDPDGDQCWG